MKSILKEFLKYASLNMVGMIGISFYILADTLFIAQGIGSDGLAALNLALPVYSVVHGTGLMLGMGGGAKYSIFHSQQKDNDGNRAFSQTVIMGLCFAILYVLYGLTMSGTTATLLGADSATFEMTKTYLKVTLLFAPAFILNQITIVFVRNDGSPKLCTAAMLAGSIANTILDYIFIFPLKMGIFGAVLATGFSPIFSLSVLSLHFLKHKNNFKFIPFKPSVKLGFNILSIGFSSFINELSSGVVIIVFNMLMLRLSGNIGVAAYGVVTNISLVVIAIFTGLSQGAQPILSRNFGLNKPKNIKLTLKYAAITVTIISALIYTLLNVLKEPIVLIFNSEHNAQLQTLAEDGIMLYFTACVFAGINILLTVYFSAIEKPTPAWIISFLRGFLVIIPVSIIMANLFGVNGLWLSFPLTELIVFIVGITLIKFGSQHRDSPAKYF